MWRSVLIGVGFLYVVVACYMWFVPQIWYDNTPGVAMMGAYNLHFIRDLALVFLMSAGGLLWGASQSDRTAVVMGTIWPCLHAVFHIWIWFGRGIPVDTVAMVNLIGIQLPAWLAVVAATKLKVNGAVA